MRIIHIAQPFDAGVPRIAGQLVAYQSSHGYETVVASVPAGDLHRFAVAAGVEWREWPATRSPRLATIAETRRLAQILRDVRPDLVHLHSAKAGLTGRLAIRGRLPTVFQPNAWSFQAVEGAQRQLAVLWERIAARWADAIVCVSEDERHAGEAAGVHGRWELVPNGVDLTQYAMATSGDRRDARSRLGLGEEPLAVVVGRLSRQKGQDVLLRAWSRVLERVPDARLALIGDGPDRHALEAIGASRVFFAGPSDNVRTWFAAATVAVIPSRWEGGPLVVMEAMACGRSVVASAVADMRDVLDDEAGAVVAIEDEAALAEALAARLADPALADREGAAGRARAEKRHDSRLACERMLAVYRRVLAQRKSS